MECEKCFSPWDTETHIPKILACGHTICQNCIYEMSKKYYLKKKNFLNVQFVIMKLCQSQPKKMF